MQQLRGPTSEIAHWLIRHRLAVVVSTVLATLPLLWPLLQLRVGFSVRSFLQSEEPELRAATEHYGEFSSPDRLLPFWFPVDDPWAPEALDRLRRFDATARAIDGVERLFTLASVAGPGDSADELQAVANSRVWRRLLVAVDGTALGGVMLLGRERDDAAIFASLQAAAADASLDLHLAGLPFHRSEVVALIRSDQANFLPLGTGVSLALLLWLIPGVGFALLSMLVVPLTLVATLGIMSLCGVGVTMLTSTLPCLLMAMAIADGVHMVGRFLEERRSGASPETAAARTFEALCWPCFLTSLTTGLGFATLTFTVLPDLRDLGVFAALGVGLAFVYTVLLLPPVLSMTRRVPARRRLALPAILATGAASLLRRSPAVVLVPASLLLTVAGVLATGVSREETLTDDLWPDSPLARSHREYADKFVGYLPGELLVTAADGFGVAENRAQLASLVDWLEGREVTDRTLSLVDLVRDGVPPAVIGMAASSGQLPGGLLSADGRTARVLLCQRDLGSSVHAALRADLARRPLPSHWQVRFAGAAVVAHFMSREMVKDLVQSFFGSLLAIFLLVGASCRSMRLGLLAMVPNLVPMVITLAVMAAADVALRPLTVITFCIAFGLAVDDAVHLLARYREGRSRGDASLAALEEALRHAGQPVVVTTLLLMVGFGTILVSEFRGTFQFGLLVLLALTGSLLGALWLLPALIRVSRSGDVRVEKDDRRW